VAKQEAGLKMTISIGFDTIKLISKRFTLNQFSIEEFFHNCQENGIYADKKLSTFTKDKDFIKYLKSKFADPYLYHDVNGLKLPAKSGSYFLNIDIDQALTHQGNGSPFDHNASLGHIRVNMRRNSFSNVVELKIETELSRFLDPFHYNFKLISSDDHLKQAFNKMEDVLGIMGIHLNILDCNISRLDVSEDYQAPYDIETLSSMLDVAKWKSSHNEYGNGGLIILSKAKTNIQKLRKFSYYDKIQKIKDQDLPKAKACLREAHKLKKNQVVKMLNARVEYLQTMVNSQSPTHHLLRREYRWETKKAVIEDLGLNTVKDLIEKGIATCEIAKNKIHDFIKYRDGELIDFSKEMSLTLNQTKALLSYHGIIALFHTLDHFEDLLLSGKLDDLIDTSTQSKKLYMKKLREDEALYTNLAMRIKPLSCADLQKLPSEYDVNHRFIEDLDEDEEEDINEDGSDDGSDDWDDDDRLDDGSDDWDDDDGSDDWDDGSEDGSDDWDEDGSEDGSDDWDEDGSEDGSDDGSEDGSDDWDKDGSDDWDKDGSDKKASLIDAPDTNEITPPADTFITFLKKNTLDIYMCLNDQRTSEDHLQVEALKSHSHSHSKISFWGQVENIKKAIKDVKEARSFIGLNFDDWYQSQIDEYEKAFPPVAYDPLELIPEWHNQNLKVRNCIKNSRKLLIDYMLHQSKQTKTPKPISDKGFERWWIKFKPSLDQEALDLMAMLSMDFEVKNVLKKSMLIEVAGESND
jgi:hypothetical protein